MLYLTYTRVYTRFQIILANVAFKYYLSTNYGLPIFHYIRIPSKVCIFDLIYFLLKIQSSKEVSVLVMASL